MHLEDEYPGQIRQIVRTIREEPTLARCKYTSAEVLAEMMRPDSPHNHLVFDALAATETAYLRIKPGALTTALNTKRRNIKRDEAAAARLEAEQKAAAAKQEAKQKAEAARLEAKQKADAARLEAHQKAMEARDQQRAAAEAAKLEAKRKAAEARHADVVETIEAELDGVPANECEYIDLLMAKRGTIMTFDRQFSANDGRLTAEEVLLDAHLTAANLNLVKPRGDLLSATNIDRALGRWAIRQREACVHQVNARISQLPEGLDREVVLTAFEALCEFYFKEPGFASKAVQKIFWQIKRMLLELPVPQRHMLILVGEQNSGKTFVERMITKPLSELVAEASLKDVLDERQMELPTYGAILLDELVAADRADCAAWKNFITGEDWARRPMRSNLIEKVRLRATLLGTSNHSLGKLIFDSTGMRRFIELMVKPRHEIEPHWKEIVTFPWLQLWQAIDVQAEDPLMSSEYADLLLAKQEALRTADNTELWARQFEPSRINCKAATGEWIEYYAGDLYQEFRIYEEQFDRAWRGTNLTRWGREMKSMIDSDRLPNWNYHKVGSKVVYRVALPEDTNVIHALRARMPR